MKHRFYHSACLRSILSAGFLLIFSLLCLSAYQQYKNRHSVRTEALLTSRIDYPYLNELVRDETLYTWDAYGKLLRADVYRNGEYESYSLYTYTEAGELLMEQEFQPDGSLSWWILYTCDSEGRVCSKVRRNWQNVLSYTIVYTYDEEGHLLSETKHDTDADSEITSCTEYTYDDTGALLTSCTTQQGGGYSYIYVEYITDSEGGIRAYTSYDIDGLLIDSVTYSRDDYGAITSIVYDTPSEEGGSEDRYDYLYSRDETGALLQAVSCFNGLTYYEETYTLTLITVWNTQAAAAGMEAGYVLDETAAQQQAQINEADLDWDFDISSGTLTISGNGEMNWSESEWAPWISLVHETDATPISGSAVQKVVFEEGLTTIAAYSFGYPNMTSVSLPETIEFIHRSAFAFSALREITIPEGVPSIERYTFCDCENLEWIYIPNSVTVIRTSAFDGCSGLTDVYFGGSESDWEAIEIWPGNEILNTVSVHFST